MNYSESTRTTSRRIPSFFFAGLFVVSAAIAALGYQLLLSSSSPAASSFDVLSSEHRSALSEALPGRVWPAHGQAAVQTGQSKIHPGLDQPAAPIASLAKVMTAYVVLRDHRLRPGQDGPTITLTDNDVADTDRRREQDESVVSIAAGEQLTERQALQALLLASANNIAAVLARWDAGSADRFVAQMNATARSLGMIHTHYTDPSGYDDATVSTAADQVRVVDRAMRLPAFARIVAAGGGCFAFRAIRWIDGKRTTITGVVLGQPGQDQIAAGLTAAAAMVNGIAGQGAVPDSPQPTPAPGPLPRIAPGTQP